MLDVNAPFQKETIQNINESVNQGLSYHRINNMKYLYYVFLVNANGNYVQLTPEGVKFLEIDDSILEYSLSGTIIIQNDNEMIETLDSVYCSLQDAERELNKRHKGVDSTIEGEYNTDGSFITFIYDCHIYHIYQFMVRKTNG